jgi:acetate kinase
MRKAILANMDAFGISVDAAKNEVAIRGAQMDISKDGTPVRILVIPTNEELMIAKETLALVD